jgi:hypothetical protein
MPNGSGSWKRRVWLGRKVLVFAAVAEVVTGLALLIVPSLIGQLLLAHEFGGVALPVARLTGIALIGLGVGCWPGPSLLGMIVYGAAVALYFTYLGSAGEFAGVLLWPAVVLHAVLSFFLGRAWLASLR